MNRARYVALLGTLRPVLLGASVLLATLVGSPASAATAITACPFIITQPGQYVLTQDLSCAENGIIIRASNVHLTLAGYTLTGPNDGTGMGIWVQGTAAAPLIDVHINGGVVERFGIGIYAKRASRSRINGVVSRENVAGALTGDGLRLEDSLGNEVTGNTFAMNEGFGARFDNADDNQFTGNAVTENVGPWWHGGLLLMRGSTANRILSSSISGNGECGIWLFDPASGGNLIQGCVVNDNDVLPGTAQAGIVILSSGNTIRDNEVSRNRAGISLSFNARQNLVQGNTALRNRLRDLQDFNLPSRANTWRNNQFEVDNERRAAAGPRGGIIR